ncbi:SdrD B-like domain-containing protein, partial [Psychromicrobium xiongbiense]|uniref:SdrD B-like domain-containing protein n=1 Tax=Psychromicrobium xiongbiense TaxID=3051184 RepID=UPI002553E89A
MTTPASGMNSATTPDNPTIDAGLVPVVSIGDFVWQDTNRTGVQDAGEPGVAGVKVNLLDASGTPVKDASGNPSTTTTNASGFYSFTNLTPSTTYPVQFVAPAGQVFTTPRAGTDRTNDSNPGANGQASVTTPASGMNAAPTPDDPTIDAGLVPVVSIGDFVWQDTNRTGVQDAGEPGVAGVKVNLLDASGTPVKDASGNPSTTTTNASGFYSFTNLTPSTTYPVQFVAPAGQVFTTPRAGTDRTNDSNPGANGQASVTTPASGMNSATTPDDPTIDAGLV